MGVKDVLSPIEVKWR